MMIKNAVLVLCVFLCSCGEHISISEIQDVKDDTSFKDQFVKTKGIVTGVFQEAGELEGFFIQDHTIFSNRGIFVKTQRLVHVGDEILITAKVVEYKNETRLESVQSIQLLSEGNSVSKQSVSLPISLSKMEQLEGSLIHIENELLISSSYSFLKYGQILLSTSELVQATEIYDAQLDSQKIMDLSSPKQVNSIVIDDLSNMRFPFLDSLYCKSTDISIGNKCSGIIGFVSQFNDDYRIRLIDDILVEAIEKEESSSVKGALKVMSFNLHNLFNGDGKGDGFPTPRGAKTYKSYQLQLAKLKAAICAADPDIIAMMELENDGEDSLSTLVQFCIYLNLKNPSRKYTVSLTGTSSSSDFIKTGIIYDANSVTALTTAKYHKNPIFSRPPLFQRFNYGGNSEFILSVNHFKSKSPRGAERLNEDQKDGQAAYNYKRKQQAEVLLNLVDSLYENDDLLIVGDFNAYTNEDPIQLLESNNLKRLEVSKYSYEYKGRKGNLDHAFVSKNFESSIKEIKVWDINVSYPNWIDYRHELADSTYYRSSDHNPILIGLY
jgi:hypothetical protein